MSSVFGAVNLAACGYQIYHLYYENLYKISTQGRMNMTSIFFVLIGGALSSIVRLSTKFKIEVTFNIECCFFYFWKYF